MFSFVQIHLLFGKAKDCDMLWHVVWCAYTQYTIILSQLTLQFWHQKNRTVKEIIDGVAVLLFLDTHKPVPDATVSTDDSYTHGIKCRAFFQFKSIQRT